MSAIFLNRYESMGQIGLGSMGEVHLARLVDNPSFHVAVKFVRRDLVDVSKKAQYFEREIQNLGRLQSPYIGAIFDGGIDERVGPCLVMEFVQGYSLDAVLKKERRLHPLRVARLLSCLCHGMEVAHAAGIIHRDLKPANLMIVGLGTPEEHLKVMDFGLAAMSTKPHLSRERLSSSDMVIAQGTPAYLSPEQVRGDDIDGRADIYSTGMILYEMLTGAAPYDSRSLEQLIQAHINDQPKRFAERGIYDLSPEIEAVVRRCLSKYAPERYSTARELAKAFDRAVGHDSWNETRPPDQPATQGEVNLSRPEIQIGAPKADPTAGAAVVHCLEVRMSDRIAAMKIGGFLNDQGAQLLDSQPGQIKARFMPPKSKSFMQKLFGGGSPNASLELDIHLDRPAVSENRLKIVAAFRPSSGIRLSPENQYRCDSIIDELRKYLMIV